MRAVLALFALLLFLSLPAKAEGLTEDGASETATLSQGDAVALDHPHMDDKKLAGWLQQSAVLTMSFSHRDAMAHMRLAAAYFTSEGWDGFMQDMHRSHILESVITQQQVLLAEGAGDPLIVERGAHEGRYTWVVQVPLRLTYKTGKDVRVDDVKVNMIAERAAEKDYADGVAIAKWSISK